MAESQYNETILIVDDNPTNLEVLSKTLIQTGYQIAVAVDGESAVRLVEYQLPSLILLDVMLPGIDGFETCRRLKLNPVSQDIPIIFMTALTDTEYKIKGFSFGAVDYVTKPFHREEVLARVQSQIKLYTLSKALEVQNDQLRLEIQQRESVEFMLRQAREEAEKANEAKSHFLANMSHELRTPLNAILGMTEGLTDQIFGPINERQIKALETVDRSGTHLLELINDILDIAKIESGQTELECTLISVSSLCQSSLVFIKQQALQKRIQIETQLSADLPDLCCDERQIRQVLINLLNNAVKFTPEGGKITLEAQLSKPGFLRITVADTGIGIAPENIGKLFQPFIQIDCALNRQYQGTGLGLSLVKRIVELHDGEVSLTSEVGIGSSFMIDLPCMSSPLCAYEVSRTGPSPSVESKCITGAVPLSRTPSILLVEDNEANVATVSSYLEAKGYDIIVAKNGHEAIAMAHSETPDLILMDIQMPELDGFEAMQKIRRNPALTTVPIIALSALAMTGDRERCIEAGADEYISKPIRMRKLHVTMQQLLSASCSTEAKLKQEA